VPAILDRAHGPAVIPAALILAVASSQIEPKAKAPTSSPPLPPIISFNLFPALLRLWNALLISPSLLGHFVRL
jgi:hypothetical protein